MESLFLLIPMSLLLITLAIGVFIWSVRNRQFEDLDKEAHSILFDEEMEQGEEEEDNGQQH